MKNSDTEGIDIVDAINTKKTLTEYLNEVNYSVLDSYVPSKFSVELVNLIKMVNGGAPEDVTPVVHYYLLDRMFCNSRNIINLCFRGFAKSSIMRYLIWYMAIYGKLPCFSDIVFALYITDTVENGVKTMKRNLEFEYENSAFLREFIPHAKITEQIWEFRNADGHRFTCQGYGAQGGVRGTTVNGERPKLALLDDLMSDKVADSPTCIENIEKTVYRAVRQALNPKYRKIIWNGTPFNARDPLHKAIESGSWEVNVFPVCEEFPCAEEDFKGAWKERFTYEFVKTEYEELKQLGKVADFNQELMLRIMSAEDRLIEDTDICWYKRDSLLSNRDKFNFYITTDFATSEADYADYSVISVWAINNKGYWFLVDGICKKQLMDKNIDSLFYLANVYQPQEVGIEVSGQQGGFIPWIMQEMLDRNIYFNLASGNNSNNPGIRPNSRVSKIARFNVVVPWFKAKHMFFPSELKDTLFLKEMLNELTLVSPKGMKSKHDDCLDTISMLSELKVWRPSEMLDIKKQEDNSMWEIDVEDGTDSSISSYIV